MSEELKLFAVVNTKTKLVAVETGGPFDGKDLDAAYVEVALTYVKDFGGLPDSFRSAAVARFSLASMGLEVVPLTPDLEAQYPAEEEEEAEETPKKGKSIVSLSSNPYYVGLVRCIQVMPVFDAIGLGVILNQSFGTISGRLAEMENEGFLLKVRREDGGVLKTPYSQNELKRNPDVVGRPINFGKAKTGYSESRTYQKNEKLWPEFMTRWRGFLLGEQAKGKWPKKEWIKGKGWKVAEYVDGKWVYCAD